MGWNAMVALTAHGADARNPLKRRRKACQKETSETLARIGLPQRSRETIIGRDEFTRFWIAQRCFDCLRCPETVTRLARWHAGIGEV